jgi:CBS domain-containing protein
MQAIRELIQGREVFTVEDTATVLTAAQHMKQHNIGALPVVRGGKLVGIFTERDLMKRVVAEQRDPAKTTVADVMTKDPRVVGPEDSFGKCLIMMKEHGFRHVPVSDGQELKGLVSLRDILLREVEEKDGEVQMMRAYIHTNT